MVHTKLLSLRALEALFKGREVRAIKEEGPLTVFLELIQDVVDLLAADGAVPLV